MLYRTIKKNNDKLSILGFGCMRLPQKHGRIDEKRAKKQIHLSIEKGVNYFDTAMPYHMGASEPFLGRALSNGLRQKVKIATKLTPFYFNKHEDMDRILTTQLEYLQTDHIDYYLLHSLDRRFWNKMLRHDALEFLERNKKKGRIINAGFSFHGDKDVFKEIVDAYDWDFCQIQYNYLDEQNQAGTEGLSYAAHKGLGVIVMEPLRGGMLTKKIPPTIESVWNEAEVTRTPAEWALRWIWDHPQVTCILSGMNEEDHIEENIRVANEALPNSLKKDELKLVNRARDTYKQLCKVDCTGCRYCMPCPDGVDIPTCFEGYNNYHMFGKRFFDKLMAYMRLAGIDGEPSLPSLCTECKKCIKNCPQHIDIPKELKLASEAFEGRMVKAMVWLMKIILERKTKGVLRKAEQAEKAH